MKWDSDNAVGLCLVVIALGAIFLIWILGGKW